MVHVVFGIKTQLVFCMFFVWFACAQKHDIHFIILFTRNQCFHNQICKSKKYCASKTNCFEHWAEARWQSM